jgi:hypothetical protein
MDCLPESSRSKYGHNYLPDTRNELSSRKIDMFIIVFQIQNNCFRSRKRLASRGKKYLLEEDLLIDIDGGDVLPFKDDIISCTLCREDVISY